MILVPTDASCRDESNAPISFDILYVVREVDATLAADHMRYAFYTNSNVMSFICTEMQSNMNMHECGV